MPQISDHFIFETSGLQRKISTALKGQTRGHSAPSASEKVSVSHSHVRAATWTISAPLPSPSRNPISPSGRPSPGPLDGIFDFERPSTVFLSDERLSSEALPTRQGVTPVAMSVPLFFEAEALLSSVGKQQLAQAVEALLAGETARAHSRLRQALDFSPELVAAWELMLRCIGVFRARGQSVPELGCVTSLAQALEAAWPNADRATWLQLVQRFDVVCPAATTSLQQATTLGEVKAVRTRCEVDLLMQQAIEARAGGRIAEAVEMAYQAFRRDPLNSDAFDILSQQGNKHILGSLYDDAFAF